MVNTREIATQYRLAQVMQERAQSGLSIKAYCEQLGICRNTYFYWHRRVRAAAAAAAAALGLRVCNETQPSQVCFNEIRVAERSSYPVAAQGRCPWPTPHRRRGRTADGRQHVPCGNADPAASSSEPPMLSAEGKQVYLACGCTDMRKSINWLIALVEGNFKLDPFGEALFVFCNRSRDRLRILQWDGDGFWLHFKRLEKGHFRWSGSGEASTMTLSVEELNILLGGATRYTSDVPYSRKH